MLKLLAAYILGIFLPIAALAQTTALHEPVFLPLNVFAPAQHAHFRLKVSEGRKFNAIIVFETAPANVNVLSALARRLCMPDADVKLSLPAHLKIADLEKHEIILDHMAKDESLYESSGTRMSFRIQEIRLEKGEYEVEVETLAALDRIDGITSTFGFFVRKV
jgi:hypothetical protein